MIGTSQGKELAQRLLAAFVQSPSRAMVEEYGERLARYDADVAVRGVHWLVENCEGRPSIAAMRARLDALQGEDEGISRESVAAPDPFAALPAAEQVRLLERGVDFLGRMGVSVDSRIIRGAMARRDELVGESDDDGA